MTTLYCDDPSCVVCELAREKAHERREELRQYEYEHWLMTEGADYLFENGRGE